MIYIKNNTEIQTIFIPRNELQKEAYIASTKTYEDGYRDGLEDGKGQQKDKLLNLYVTENGQYEREDGWGVVTVDTPDCSDAYNKGYEDGYNQGQAECPDCPEGGSCNLGEGEFVFGTSDVGRYELNASDDGYDGWSKIYLEIEGEGAIKVHRASDLLDSFNNDNGAGLDYGRNYYVGGEITEVREISTQYGNATYILDNGLQIYRGKWIDGNAFSSEDQIKVGAYIVVYGVLAEYKGTLQLSKNSQVIAYQECTGGEIISCNLEDKSVTPSMSDRDGNNLIVVEESEGYDGLSRVVIDPQTIYNEGVEAGKADGINEQKSKLESISITENGVYSKEDGYSHIEVNVPDLNGSYDEGFNVGYEQGQADVAANARVLDVTENGVYRTKFSDPIIPANYTVTGVYADGTNFYSYTELNGKVFNTKIAGSVDSRLEFWYKGDNQKSGDAWNVIIGSGDNDDSDCFQVRYFISFNNQLRIEVGNSAIIVNNWDDTVWHHLIVSKAEGLWIDGEKKGDFSPSNTINGEFFINGIGYVNNGIGDGLRNANGTFGMIKIDDVVIIPTADGFQNVNTGELLEVVKDGAYTFTENTPIYAEGELYKTINVNVPSVQEQITDYYYCPITITDSGFGDRAKSFMVKNESMYGENGWINDDSFVYLPTANNMNEVRTKTSPSLVASFPFDDNAAQYTGALYMNVEQIQMNNVVLPNLYKLELGSGCHTLHMDSSNLPNINTLIIRYNGQQLFDYHFGLTQFKNGGKLYVYKGLGSAAENLRAALGSEWTIEYL